MGIGTGSLAGLAVLGLGLFGYNLATPEEGQNPSTDKRVSAKMSNATLDEVAQWLSKSGVNFVIDKGALKDTRVNLNIVDKPLRDVMDAIANAVGASWVKSGDIYALRPGFAGVPMPDMGAFEGFVPGLNMDELRKWESEMHGPEHAPRVFEMDPERMRKFEMELAPKIREHMKELEGFEFPMPEIMEELHKEGGALRMKMLDSEKIEQLLESMTPQQKELMHSRGFLKHEDLTAKQREILGPFGKMGTFSFNDGDRKITIRGTGEGLKLERELAIPPAAPLAPPAPRTDVKQLVESLTPAQKDLMRAQGHLFVDQLTDAQRRMMHVPTGGSFTLSISDGSTTITIKSRD